MASQGSGFLSSDFNEQEEYMAEIRELIRPGGLGYWFLSNTFLSLPEIMAHMSFVRRAMAEAIASHLRSDPTISSILATQQQHNPDSSGDDPAQP